MISTTRGLSATGARAAANVNAFGGVSAVPSVWDAVPHRAQPRTSDADGVRPVPYPAAEPGAEPAAEPGAGPSASPGPISAILLDAGGVLLFPAPELLLPPLHAAGLEPTVAELERAHYRAMADCDRPGRDHRAASGGGSTCATSPPPAACPPPTSTRWPATSWG